MNNKTLWLDVDGVLLDYTRPFLKFAALPMKYDDVFDYALSKLFVTGDECAAMMTKFHTDPVFATLPVIANKHLLLALKDYGYSLKIITKLPDEGDARKHRHTNLVTHFGEMFDQIVFVDKECKLEYLQHQDGHNVLIEDNSWLLDKYENGSWPIEVLAIKHPYNKSVTDKLVMTVVYDTTDEALIRLLQIEEFNKINGE